MVVQRATVTDEQILAALQGACGGVHLAAQRLGCGPEVIYRRASEVAEIRRATEEFPGRIGDMAQAVLMRAVLDGDSWAVKLAFELRDKALERPGSESFLTQSGHTTIQDVLQALLENDRFLEYSRENARSETAGNSVGDTTESPGVATSG